jgi:hypothetical protein
MAVLSSSDWSVMAVTECHTDQVVHVHGADGRRRGRGDGNGCRLRFVQPEQRIEQARGPQSLRGYRGRPRADPASPVRAPRPPPAAPRRRSKSVSPWVSENAAARGTGRARPGPACGRPTCPGTRSRRHGSPAFVVHWVSPRRVPRCFRRAVGRRRQKTYVGDRRHSLPCPDHTKECL